MVGPPSGTVSVRGRAEANAADTEGDDPEAGGGDSVDIREWQVGAITKAPSRKGSA
jgi:hypothetical protein